MTVTPEGQDIVVATALDGLRMNKMTARDTIQKTLPVAETIIERHQRVLLDLGNAAREKRAKVPRPPSPPPPLLPVSPEIDSIPSGPSSEVLGSLWG